MTPRRQLTVAEVAQILRVTPERVYALIGRLELPAVRVGRDIRVDPDALAAWIRAGGTAQFDTDDVGT
jgi:excisionase family DNA binding protein